MRIPVVAAMCLASLCFACTEDEPKETSGTGAGASGGGGVGGTGGTPIAGATTVTGEVRNEQDAPMADAELSLCAGADCITTTSDAAGAFVFENAAPGALRFDARGPAADSPPTIGGVTVAIDIEADTPFAFQRAIVLPTTGPGKTLSGGMPESVEVTTELEITANADELTLPASVASPYLAGVLVRDEHFPPNVVPDSTVAMWVFNPYGATSSMPARVAIDNVFSLPADEFIELHTVDHETGLVVKVAEGRVSPDAMTISIDVGISTFTWLILALVT